MTRVLMLLAILLVSCDWSEATQQAVKEVSPRITFFKHQPSGLCFAFMLYDRSAALTEVPCEKVQGLLTPAAERSCP